MKQPPPIELKQEPTISSAIVRSIIDYWCRCGADINEFSDILGPHRRFLNDPDHRLPASVVSRLFVHAADLFDDRALGLRTGCHIPTNSYGVLSHVIIASKTVGQMFKAVMRYGQLVSGLTTARLETNGEQSRMIYIPTAEVSYHMLDMCLATFAKHSQMLVPDHQASLLFGHPPYLPLEEYRSILHTPNLVFDQLEYSASFPTKALDYVIGFGRESDYISHTLRAESALRKFNSGHSSVQRVREALVSLFYQGEPGIADAAELLGISVRKLQRDLQEEGISFRNLLDETRMELAMDYLERGKYPIYEIAFLVGYRETSSFYKAFKRWMGKTPKEYMLERSGLSALELERLELEV